MRIAIVGAGISGLVAARMLSRDHEITLFEAGSHVGGHANTVSVYVDGEDHQIDTGFIVYNDRTYPKFSRLLAQLEVETAPTSMSFSVRCDRTGLEYNGTSPNGVFAQRRNIMKPSFLRMLRDVRRFNREGSQDLASVPESQTVADYVADNRYSREFSSHYLYPMGAAIWSCHYSHFASFSIKFILKFYANHGLLSLRDRPTWRVVRGGSARYVDRLTEPFLDRIRLSCSVQSVTRHEDDVRIRHSGGDERFDEVVFACHSDQALRLLADADALECELLSAFPYSANSAVLHTDQTLLPKRRRAWASWNYHIRRSDDSRPTVTYNMNMLQHIQSKHTFCVTLNEDDSIAPNKILGRYSYSHPVFTTNRAAVQHRHDEVIRRRRTSYCGAYWRNGFHEDGVVSALTVCEKFGLGDLDVALQKGLRAHRLSTTAQPANALKSHRTTIGVVHRSGATSR